MIPNHQEMRQHMIALVQTKMPFGKYRGSLICDLPESYLVWFHAKGFPPGKLGVLMSTIYEIKLNGIEEILIPIREEFQK